MLVTCVQVDLCVCAHCSLLITALGGGPIYCTPMPTQTRTLYGNSVLDGESGGRAGHHRAWNRIGVVQVHRSEPIVFPEKRFLRNRPFATRRGRVFSLFSVLWSL